MGKTSIMNRVCGKDFNSTEKPTIGTRLAQHTLGKLVIDVWDTAGQHTQFGSVKAKSRRADILLAVYDVSNKDSLRVLEERLTEIVRDGECGCVLLFNDYWVHLLGDMAAVFSIIEVIFNVSWLPYRLAAVGFDSVTGKQSRFH